MKTIEIIPLLAILLVCFFRWLYNIQENKKLAIRAKAIDKRFNDACIKNFMIQGYPREQTELRHKWVQGRITDEEKEIHRKFCETFVVNEDPFSSDSVEKVESMANSLGIVKDKLQ